MSIGEYIEWRAVSACQPCARTIYCHGCEVPLPDIDLLRVEEPALGECPRCDCRYYIRLAVDGALHICELTIDPAGPTQ